MITITFEQIGHTVDIPSNDANGMTNSVDLDETATLDAV